MPRAPKAAGHAAPRPPWRNSRRRAELPANWHAIRARVKKRAGERCEAVDGGVRCAAPGTDCDHVVPGGPHTPENLQWLCRDHHRAKSSREGARAARRDR